MFSAEGVGKLRADQQAAAKAMLKHDTGVLCAPTAFDKTVTTAAWIASRGVNTLVLVRGKAKPTGRVDVAVMQSLVGRGQRQGEVSALIESYGHVIVDECHH